MTFPPEQTETTEAPSWMEYWQVNFEGEPYRDPGMEFDDYSPAYRIGAEHPLRLPGQQFEDIEGVVRARWDFENGGSPLSWEQARDAVRAAWERRGFAPDV